jgi:hypothetical protein
MMGGRWGPVKPAWAMGNLLGHARKRGKPRAAVEATLERARLETATAAPG